jgi:4-hydroxy-2-oxoheptanedioate aldolase
MQNRVHERCERGEASIGAYVTLADPAAVEVAAIAGLDFVRLDAYHHPPGPAALGQLIGVAAAAGVTPWVRVRNDPWEIAFVLDQGALAVTVPNIGTVDEARAVVQAASYPPLGIREMNRPIRYHDVPLDGYLAWAEREVMVGCQIEDEAGLVNHESIVSVPGLDVIHTGRNDLALALGVPGQPLHPTVLAAEERVVNAALEAGKEVSLHHPLTRDGIERARRWRDRGVRILSFDLDRLVLLREYRGLVAAMTP